MSNPLIDKDFLYSLDNLHEKEIYAKVTALSFNEYPLETIEGRITGGSINIDGTSTVRRTCSLALVAQEININEFYWGLNTKLSISIGIKNTINSNYDDIIWFPQGIYILTAFSTSFNTNNYTVSISGKDKMCLLNGDIGGNLPASVDFGKIDTTTAIYEPVTFTNYLTEYTANKYYIKNPTYSLTNGQAQYIISNDEYNANNTYYKKNVYSETEQITLDTIIKEAVHTYGHELYENIIINDLDDYGLELLEYRGDKTLYLLYDEDKQQYTNMTLNNEQQCYIITNYQEQVNKYIQIKDDALAAAVEQYREDNDKFKYNNAVAAAKETCSTNIKNIEGLTVTTLDDTSIVYNSQVENFDADRSIILFLADNTFTFYSIIAVEKGQTVGYKETDLTYAGELISSVGDSLTTILDKIKNTFSDFEYFYDVNGKFIWQKKKTYVNTSWNNIVTTDDNDIYTDINSNSSAASYNFTNNNLITAFQNTPNLAAVRNDFSVWGVKKSTSGQNIKIHMRYAIDKKPTYYKSIAGIEYLTDSYDIVLKQTKQENLNASTTEITSLMENKICGCDWRELIYQMSVDYYKYNQDDDFLYLINKNNTRVWLNNGNYEITQYYPNGVTGYEQYYIDMQAFWRQLYNPNAEYEYTYTGGKYDADDNWVAYTQTTTRTCDYYLPNTSTSEDQSTTYPYWNKQIITGPENLNFWIDFLDTTGDINKYSVPYIGDRSKAVNDDDITGIYFRETAKIIFADKDTYSSSNIKSGYVYVLITPQMKNLFTISSQGKSAKDMIDSMLYTYAYCAESVTITALPVYYLAPNTRIFIQDEKSQINGDYIISKISLPLAYNGTMSITATKAVDRLY